MGKIIKAINLIKKYADFTAVNSVNFHVNKGEIFGFLGPNGAGKTTTINMLIGMAKISGGKIFYRDEDLTNNIKKAQNIIGVVADESNLYDEMSGYENLCFCGSLYGIPKNVRKNKAQELLEIFGLTEAANKKYKAYSKGMKRKLAISAALIHNPEILFLDEPTTGIDIVNVRQIRKLIKELNEKGATIFLTTHYIEEAERLCNRVAFINNGKILKIDTVENLVNDTRESYIIEILFDTSSIDKNALMKKIQQRYSDFNAVFKNENTLKLTGFKKINIAPVVSFLSAENLIIYEARLIKPTLEDAFIKITGIGIDLMKKEKEKK